jgi:hypothetical protein
VAGVQELAADHADVPGGVDPEPDLTALDADHRDADVVADIESLHQLPRQDQHGVTPCGGPLPSLRNLPLLGSLEHGFGRGRRPPGRGVAASLFGAPVAIILCPSRVDIRRQQTGVV